MAFSREDYLKEITKRFSILQTDIQLENEQKLYNANTVAEDVYAALINRIWGWKLHNLNGIKHDEPGIDLIDEENKIVIQVSSTNTSTKINHTIKEYEEHRGILSGYRLIMLFICGKQKSYRGKFDTKGLLIFDKTTDIWDNGTILAQLKNFGAAKLEEIMTFLNEEVPLVPNHSKVMPHYEYTDLKIEESSIESYYTDMEQSWNEVPKFETILGSESVNDSYIESNCMVNDDSGDEKRVTIISEIKRCFSNPDIHVIVLHGQPGHGKTTFCRFAVHQFYRKAEFQEYTNVFRFSLNPAHSRIVDGKK